MTKLARILLVEPESDFRRDLDRHLERAGHEVTAVPDPDAARALVLEGLLPDVVLTDGGESEMERALQEILPDAVYLRIVREPPSADPGATDGAEVDPTICPPDPGEILRRIEEVLMHHAPRLAQDDATRCMDLARRLANSLPRTRTPAERIELITDGFDAFHGVIGTLVVRRGPTDEWIEVRQGLGVELAERISAEIARRTQRRGLRPFLAGVEADGVVHQVACLAVRSGDVETDLAMALQAAPAQPAHREALMNLIGSALRSAMTEETADETRELLEARVSSFESLLSMSREFMAVGSRRDLCVAVLRSLQRELGMTRGALFLSRDSDAGMLDLQATRGFAADMLDRIGLSTFHGVGAECLGSEGPRRLATFAMDGATARELGRLAEASLRWVVPFRVRDGARGVLFFGCPDEGDDLAAADRQILHALVEAASVALNGLERFEGSRDLSVWALRGLVSAIELQHPEDRGHAERVARLAVHVGRALEMTSGELRDLAFAALLHDVGKIASAAGNEDVDDPEATERRRRAHPVVGSRILSQARSAAAVIQAVEQHHERWDGRGFPYGLHQESIQRLARIVAIANAYDHLRSGRTGADDHDDALRRLEMGAGLLWDPGLVAVLAGEVRQGATLEVAPARPEWLEDLLSAG